MMNDLLVTTAWLAEHLEDSKVRIIDIRGHVLPASAPTPHYYAHHDAYVQAHLPGAMFIDWTRDIVQPESRSQDIADPAAFAALMGRLGIRNEDIVIAYDDADGMFAARMWWALSYYGHDKVAILDGGWQKWLAEGRLVTSDVPAFTPSTYHIALQSHLRETADTVAGCAADTVLVDVRTVAEFVGEASRAARAGHIPGAINVPRGKLVNADGTMRSAEELRLIFADAGIRLDAPSVVTYCNGGVSASYGLLALRRAGVETVSVYDGSWKDWGNDPTRPIEKP